MIIFKKAEDLNQYVHRQRQKGATIGFVPTMGALHSGHISLLERSKNDNNITICSIFINPTQFNDPEDFNKYPRTIANDVTMLEKAETDILFLPAVDEIYSENERDKYLFRYGYLETVMEGAYRPDHFKGVGQVVSLLMQIVEPDKLYLGQKDYQQCLILKKLIKEILNLPAEVIIADIVREESGLAMSSRNMRLNNIEKGDAAGLYRVLQEVKSKAGTDSVENIRSWAREQLEKIPSVSKVDYIEIVNADTLEPEENWNNGRQIACVAAFVGDVRLIDNIYI